MSNLFFLLLSSFQNNISKIIGNRFSFFNFGKHQSSFLVLFGIFSSYFIFKFIYKIYIFFYKIEFINSENLKDVKIESYKFSSLIFLLSSFFRKIDFFKSIFFLYFWIQYRRFDLMIKGLFSFIFYLLFKKAGSFKFLDKIWTLLTILAIRISYHFYCRSFHFPIQVTHDFVELQVLILFLFIGLTVGNFKIPVISNNLVFLKNNYVKGLHNCYYKDIQEKNLLSISLNNSNVLNNKINWNAFLNNAVFDRHNSIERWLQFDIKNWIILLISETYSKQDIEFYEKLLSLIELITTNKLFNLKTFKTEGLENWKNIDLLKFQEDVNFILDRLLFGSLKCSLQDIKEWNQYSNLKNFSFYNSSYSIPFSEYKHNVLFIHSFFIVALYETLISNNKMIPEIFYSRTPFKFNKELYWVENEFSSQSLNIDFLFKDISKQEIRMIDYFGSEENLNQFYLVENFVSKKLSDKENLTIFQSILDDCLNNSSYLENMLFTFEKNEIGNESFDIKFKDSDLNFKKLAYILDPLASAILEMGFKLKNLNVPCIPWSKKHKSVGKFLSESQEWNFKKDFDIFPPIKNKKNIFQLIDEYICSTIRTWSFIDKEQSRALRKDIFSKFYKTNDIIDETLHPIKIGSLSDLDPFHIKDKLNPKFFKKKLWIWVYPYLFFNQCQSMLILKRDWSSLNYYLYSIMPPQKEKFNNLNDPDIILEFKNRENINDQKVIKQSIKESLVKEEDNKRIEFKKDEWMSFLNDPLHESLKKEFIEKYSFNSSLEFKLKSMDQFFIQLYWNNNQNDLLNLTNNSFPVWFIMLNIVYGSMEKGMNTSYLVKDSLFSYISQDLFGEKGFHLMLNHDFMVMDGTVVDLDRWKKRILKIMVVYCDSYNSIFGIESESQDKILVELESRYFKNIDKELESDLMKTSSPSSNTPFESKGSGRRYKIAEMITSSFFTNNEDREIDFQKVFNRIKILALLDIKFEQDSKIDNDYPHVWTYDRGIDFLKRLQNNEIKQIPNVDFENQVFLKKIKATSDLLNTPELNIKSEEDREFDRDWGIKSSSTFDSKSIPIKFYKHKPELEIFLRPYLNWMENYSFLKRWGSDYYNVNNKIFLRINEIDNLDHIKELLNSFNQRKGDFKDIEIDLPSRLTNIRIKRCEEKNWEGLKRKWGKYQNFNKEDLDIFIEKFFKTVIDDEIPIFSTDKSNRIRTIDPKYEYHLNLNKSKGNPEEITLDFRESSKTFSYTLDEESKEIKIRFREIFEKIFDILEFSKDQNAMILIHEKWLSPDFNSKKFDLRDWVFNEEKLWQWEDIIIFASNKTIKKFKIISSDILNLNETDGITFWISHLLKKFNNEN